MIVGEEVPSQQLEGGPSLIQQDLQTPHIKEEQEQPWISEEGERFLFPSVSVKSEEDEVKVQGLAEEQRVGSSSEQMETKTGEEDCGGSGAATSPRVMVKQRLTEAVEEILSLFESTKRRFITCTHCWNTGHLPPRTTEQVCTTEGSVVDSGGLRGPNCFIMCVSTTRL